MLGKCEACAREELLLAESTIRANERARLAKRVKAAIATVVPQELPAWLDGVRHGADIVLKEATDE